MNDFERDLIPVVEGQHPAPTISPRLYNLITTGLIFVGFCVMGAFATFVGTYEFQSWVDRNALLFIVGTLAGSIGGILLMSSAVKRQSVARSLVGFALFVCSIGVLAAMAVASYDLPTVNKAFLITAGITAVFGILGISFPQVFRRMIGVLSVSLLALILAQIVMSLFGVDQTWLDIAVVVVFCGFIGYDMYQATTVPPTIPNAVFMACNLFLDIMNIFLRLLRIMDENR